MRAVLDTNVLVDDDFGAYPGVDAFAIASISYAELRFGVAAARDADQRAMRSLRLRDIEQQFGGGIPFDDRAAFSYGILTELLLARGRSPRGRVADILIAAVAHSRDAAVITHNVKDFAGLESVLTMIPAATVG